ncbi:PTS sugar transporter subunit IIA [Clostridium sp. JN-9]|uniref:PTS sugar transporter subunit IIA n=1 Tax=Clostridium sp. JN-9 TaxID=2507159 RepID=UPI000FFE19B1|nr:PTS sugar transporter subunit IIA [Clostridium sp. JN-9]QAT39146.1 PTS sugar transporter subunit IIA [Clostridium sp. JN-9]
MIGVLIATHGDFGKEILKSSELILGKQDHTLTLSLNYGDSIEKFGEQIVNAIQSLENGSGVLVFTDLLGASPYNATALNSNKVNNARFRCICGVNLPMVLEALTMRNNYDLDKLTEQCMEAGMSGIKELFQELNIYNKKNN